MRHLNVQLPPPPNKPEGNSWRDAIFFIIAFLAMFGGAILGLDWLAGVVT